ncbi:nuclear pore complex protein Nup133-like isoform X2 [Dysidea avara]|uniref:nuclear pore complex protein Nup133-like isoform X2 n=1 Tax=Dysidea avara TaxID=196820 RepID=UPI0033258C88
MQTPRVSFSSSYSHQNSQIFTPMSSEIRRSGIEGKSGYSLEPYGLVQPLQVREVLKTSRDYATACLHHSGWALLVVRQKLYMWRYIGKSQVCKEFHLPSNEDHCNVNLVCFYPAPPPVTTAPFPRHVGLIAVSTTGRAISWSNVMQHDKGRGSIEKMVLDEGVAYSLECVPGVGCLLATKDCRYYIITPETVRGQHTLSVKQLSSGGMLSGFTRRFSSIWFQSSDHKVLRRVVISSSMDDSSAYILTDMRIQKWSIGNGHQQVYDVSLESLLAEHLPILMGDDDSDMNMEYVDLKVLNEHLLILITIAPAEVNMSSNGDDPPVNMATIATVILTTDTMTPRILNVLPISRDVVYQNNDDLLKWRIVHETCCHDNKTVLSVQGVQNGVLECTQDMILGSGYHEDHNLLFLAKAGVMTLQLKSIETSRSSIPVVSKKPKKHSMRRSLLPQEMPTDDYLNVLKRAFQYYCEDNIAEANMLLQQQFYHSFTQRRGLDTPGDVAIIQISSLLIDDIPDTDPRWAESQHQDSTDTNTIILYQLEDKLIAHDRLIKFFTETGLLAQTTTVMVRGQQMRTTDYLSEHAEKLAVAMSLKQLPNESLEGAIELVLKSRQPQGLGTRPNLTPQDFFYREVSCIEEVFDALLDDQERKLHHISDHDSRIRLVSTVLSTFESIIHEATQRRNVKYSLYHPSVVSTPMEFIPWTATDHVRHLVAKQLDIVVGMNIQDTVYQHKELLWQSLVDLIDVTLSGYSEQIESMSGEDDSGRRHSLVTRYDSERGHLLEQLIQVGQSNSAMALAEKYQDFPTLLFMCERTPEAQRSEMFHDYMVKFGSNGFANFVFQQYKEQGRIKELMSVPVECYSELEEFLSPYEELRWLHEVHTKQYNKAYTTLAKCAANEQQSLAKQKNHLSVSKLALLASSCPDNEKQAAMEELNGKLRLIDYQENLIKSGVHSDDLSAPLPVDQLIQLYTTNVPEDLTGAINNYLCALEMLSVFYLDHQDESFRQMRLDISSRAVLENDWTEFPMDDPLGTLKDVFFFNIAQEALDKGVDVMQVLPSVQELVNCDLLEDVVHLPAFVLIMNAGYQQLDRVINNTIEDTTDDL